MKDMSRDEAALSEIGFRERGLSEDFLDEFGRKGRKLERDGGWGRGYGSGRHRIGERRR
jgi:hypothetical protein